MSTSTNVVRLHQPDVSLQPCCGPEHVQRLASPHFAPHASHLPGRGGAGVADRDRRRVSQIPIRIGARPASGSRDSARGAVEEAPVSAVRSACQARQCAGLHLSSRKRLFR